MNNTLWTACITPFTATGNIIDFSTLGFLLRRQEKAGNGILLLGSTGESLALTEAERQEIAGFACNLKLEVPLMFGVPNLNLPQALDWLDFCQDYPIDGFLMTTPLYTKPGIHGQINWFSALLDRALKPAMLYNIPSRAGIRLHPEAVKVLQSHPNFVAIKDCSGTIDGFMDYKLAAPKIKIFCGDDYMMPSMATAGAHGLVSVAANVWPEATRQYVEKSLKGQSSDLWWQASKALFAASNPIPLKALMFDIDLLKSPTVRPPLSLDDFSSQDRESLQTLYKKINDF